VLFWIFLRILLDPEWPFWLHISSATHLIFCVVRTVRFRPLPTFWEIEFALSILRRRSLTELTDQFLLGNSLQMRLAPHLFCWRTSLIDTLSSYVKWRFSIVFLVELGCFHLFYPITKLLKLFAKNLHLLLRIDYISTCAIHFKCTLLLEDIISGHVGRRFLWPTLYMRKMWDRMLPRSWHDSQHFGSLTYGFNVGNQKKSGIGWLNWLREKIVLAEFLRVPWCHDSPNIWSTFRHSNIS